MTPEIVSEYGPDILDIVDQYLCSGAAADTPSQTLSPSGGRSSFLEKFTYGSSPPEKGKEKDCDDEGEEGEEDWGRGGDNGHHHHSASSSPYSPSSKTIYQRRGEEEEEEENDEEILATQRNLQSQLKAQESRNKAAKAADVSTLVIYSF